jgi:hypothetical protein
MRRDRWYRRTVERPAAFGDWLWPDAGREAGRPSETADVAKNFDFPSDRTAGDRLRPNASTRSHDIVRRRYADVFGGADDSISAGGERTGSPHPSCDAPHEPPRHQGSVAATRESQAARPFPQDRASANQAGGAGSGLPKRQTTKAQRAPTFLGLRCCLSPVERARNLANQPVSAHRAHSPSSSTLAIPTCLNPSSSAADVETSITRPRPMARDRR